MKNAFVTHRRVEFMDTDMAGIVHFATFFRYMETAEHELFHTLDLPIVPKQDKRCLGWPRVSCGFEYLKPVTFPGEIEVHIGVTEMGRKSITYRAEIVQEGRLLAKGHSTCVCCVVNPTQALRAITVPDDIQEKLRPYQIPDVSQSEAP